MGLALSSNPPNGRTGAPGDTFCTDCHGNPSSSINGLVDISGIPSSIDPNTTYNITVTSEITSGSPTRSGFQMVVLDGSDNDVGTLSNAGASSTITPSGGRTYFEHSPSLNFNGNPTVSWDVEWTSPSGPDMEPITFYASSILANGSGGNSGDRMKLTNVSGTLNAPIIPMTIDLIEQGDISCFDFNDGFALVEVNGGTPPYTFTWNNGETSNPATSLPAGTAELTVTDDIGTTEILSVFIDQPEELEFSFDFSNVSCANGNDGNIVLDVVGGTPPYNYFWSNGSNSSEITDLSAGVYDVIITDLNQCEITQTFTITEPDEIVITANQTDFNCIEGGSIEIFIDGGTGTHTSSWSNGVVGDIITQLDPGIYMVTVTDENNCIALSEYEILAPDDFEFTSSVTPPVCTGFNDGIIELFIGTSSEYSSILWSNGETGESISNLPPGTYSVTITDNFFCAYEESFDIIDPEPIFIVDANILDVSCGALGQIEISTVGGTGVLNSEWSNGATGNTISDLEAGTYNVEVYDDNNCSVFETFIVEQDENISYQTMVTQPSCNGDNDGAIELIFDFPSDVESVQWSTGETTSSISNLPPGSYTALITDNDFCEYNESFVIIEPLVLTLSAAASNEIICFGDVIDTLNLTTSGGTPPYSLFSGSTLISGSPTNLTAGSYEYNIVDANGCVDTIQFITASPTPLSATIAIENTTTATSNDGTALISMTGGNSPYTANGLTFMTEQLYTGFAPGFYQYTVIDASNCSLDVSFTISDGTSPCADLILNLSVSQPTCLGDEPVFSPTITGGTPPYTTVFQSQSFYDGDYTVSFVDANNCSVSEIVTIQYEDNEGPVINLADVTVALDASGNLEPYDNDIGTTDNCGGPVTIEMLTPLPDLSGPSSTAILVMATDELGNTSNQEYLLTIIDTIAPSIFCVDDITVNSCSDYMIVEPFVTDNNGSPELSTDDPGVLNPGVNEITFMAEDAFGNVSFCSVSITVDAVVEYEIIATAPSCPGESSGSVLVQSGSNIIVNFENGNSDSLTSGSHYFEILDVSTGCSVMDSVNFTDPDPLFVSNEIIFQLSESGATDGAIDLTIDGGNLPYAYSWSDENGNVVSTDASISNLPEGTYVCVITDATGCFIETAPYSISFESSITESYLQQIELYPNPFKKEIFIDSSWTLDKINIYNAQGKLVSVQQKPDGSINLEQLEAGLYLFEIIKDDEKAVKRIVKQ